ncbi:SDR family NAD(P)-dependent oxidoreductase [Zavarzinia sp.]|uniref:SDR family NAD(P)-dependent oxidoreductase n=1 Tax=Zavarzinia sp. TaxID=2027920 RepID=UPI00356A56F8
MTDNSKGVALVTGASSGIGAVFAARLARRGFDLLLVARRADRLAAVADAIRAESGRAVEVIAADLTKGADLRALATRIEQDPAISLLLNNAGTTLKGGILGNGPDEIERLLALNVTAPTVLAAAAGRAFAGRKSGTIVNIASILALAPEIFDGGYAGSKAHVLALTYSLSAQLKDAGVRVQAVLPGPVRTEIWDHAGVDADAAMPGLVMTAEDLVDAALTGLDRGEQVTIPPLADEGLYTAWNQARLALGPNLARAEVAPRYRDAA